jgi:hypothetical protein
MFLVACNLPWPKSLAVVFLLKHLPVTATCNLKYIKITVTASAQAQASLLLSTLLHKSSGLLLVYLYQHSLVFGADKVFFLQLHIEVFICQYHPMTLDDLLKVKAEFLTLTLKTPANLASLFLKIHLTAELCSIPRCPTSRTWRSLCSKDHQEGEVMLDVKKFNTVHCVLCS